MSFLEGEGRLAVDTSVQVASQLLFNQLSCHYMLRLSIWQLNPVINKIMRDPEDGLIDALASEFLDGIGRCLLLDVQGALGDPVVLFGAEDLTEEFQGRGAGDHGQSLERLLYHIADIGPEAVASPLEHLSLLREVRNHALELTLNVLFSVGSGYDVGELVEKVAPFLKEVEESLVFYDVGFGINIGVAFGVLYFEVSLLDEGGDLLELVVAVLGVVEHDAVEDLVEVRVEVRLDGHAQVFALLQLFLQLLKRFKANTHFNFKF